MIQRITADEFATSTELANYLSMPDDMALCKTGELDSAISIATEAIENKYNVSLRDMEILLTIRNAEDYSNLYHHTISEVISCNGDGVDIPFTFDGVGVSFVGSYRVLRVAYKTTATPNVERYLIEVLNRAADIFNGNE